MRYQNRRNVLLGVFGFLGAQSFLSAQDKVYICPMDPDVRSNQPGKCRRCGMELRAGIPDPVEFHMDLTLTPRAVKPNQPEQLKFSVHDPWKNRPVTTFQIVHEKLFHMFVVSQDLRFFVHDHPVFQPNGDFLYNIAFPKSGMYRVLGDFYPDGATPQLIAKTVIRGGNASAAGFDSARLLHEAGRKPAGGDDHRSAAAHCDTTDAGLFPADARRWVREIHRRLGAHAGGERRFDRPDSHASVHRRWRAATRIRARISHGRGRIGSGCSSSARAW